MTHGKIELYYRSIKNLILLDHYYSPSELEALVRVFVNCYNNIGIVGIEQSYAHGCVLWN